MDEIKYNNTVYYISHPYGGDDRNLDKAAEIVKQLIKKYPNVVFISPIHTFQFLYKELSYEDGIRQCLELLSRCDVMIDCDPLLMSRGCADERKYCKERDIPIIPLKDLL